MRVKICVLALVLACCLPPISIGGEQPLQIGMAKTFFVSRPKVFVEIVGDKFADTLKETTGLGGKLNTALGPFELGRELKARKIGFAILHGHEFASVRRQFPELQPLLIVKCNEGERAYLIVRKNSNAQSVADLAGKNLDLAVDARGHCRAFLKKLVVDQDREESKFFATIRSSGSQMDAMNDVASGKIDAALVDSVALATYKELRGPAFVKHLRILVESEEFPAPVIVYHRGALDEKVITQFRDGLVKVKSTDVGRQMMKDWRVDAFEVVPDGYDQNLNETFKSYPLANR